MSPLPTQDGVSGITRAYEFFAVPFEGQDYDRSFRPYICSWKFYFWKIGDGL